VSGEARQSAEQDAPRGHHLIVTKDEDFDPEYPYFESEVVCLNPAKCGGWQECDKPHEVDGKSAADGPWECEASAPWAEEEEFTFHGEHHRWNDTYAHAWTLPFPGCVVAASDNLGDFVQEIGLEHGEGTYAVEDDWDDDLSALDVIERVTPPDSPHPDGTGR